MATKLGRIMNYVDGLLPLMLHDPLITWPCEIRGVLTGEGGGGSARKRLSRHRLLVILNLKSSQHARQSYFTFTLHFQSK